MFVACGKTKYEVERFRERLEQMCVDELFF